MARGPRLLLENVCYHIMARGNQKQRVFFAQEDYEEYIRRLKKYKERYAFKLYSFCLMPNHVHLIGESKKIKDLPRFMQVLQRSYTEYFNHKYQKVGHLWQNRFKSKIIVKDEYLISCLHYLELNPVRAKLVNMPKDYPWSSYQERVLEQRDSKRLIEEMIL